jgi:hypothetical protein
MPRAKLTFRRRDVTAAVKAFEAAGHVVGRVEIAPDGSISVIAIGLASRKPNGTDLTPEEQLLEAINARKATLRRTPC